MQKHYMRLLLVMFLLGLTACTEPLIDTGVSKTLFVAPATAVCESEAGSAICLQIREQGALPWQYSLDGIEGFEYEAGYFYELQVREWIDEGPTTDGSGVRYVLEAQTNKEPAIVQTVLVGLQGADCEAEADQPCLGIKADPQADLQPWPGQVVGFEPQEGYVYELQIAQVQDADAQLEPATPWVLLNLVDAQLAETADGDDGATAVATGDVTVEGPSATATHEAVLGNATATAAAVAKTSSTPEPPETTPIESEDTTSDLVSLPFVGSRWFLVALHGEPVIDGSAVTAVFASDRQLSGLGGCNEYFGPYAANDEGALSVGLLAATRLSCEEALRAQENDILTALETAVAYRFTETELTIIAADDQETLTFAASTPTTLRGTPWRMTTYADNNGKMVDHLADSMVTAVFATDGSLTGSAGCNAYSSNTIIDRETLSIDLPQASLTICDDPVDIMAQETAYLANLTLVTSYQLIDSRLQLLNELGEVVLIYEIQSE